jgi:ketosteroid isomerase-like protein
VAQRNVELMRQGFEAMTRADLSELLALIHPDFEVEIPPDVSAEPDVYRGHDGMRRYIRSFQASMEDIRFEPERMWEVGDEVVVELRLSATGKSSGIPVELRTGQVWRIVDGRAVAARVYADVAAALESVGLREQPGAGS